ALLAFQESAGLCLCQHIICHNPARLPTPAQWVTVERSRLKDSFTHVWWMAAQPRTKADNRKVLTPYGARMNDLLRRGSYNAGMRPSGHRISKTGFLTNHGGAIAPSMIDVEGPGAPSSVLRFSNTAWEAGYVEYCKTQQLEPHPARMRPALAAFFIEFLTDPGDLVLDPFAGSNTTGAVAERIKRRWLSVEANRTYAEGSKGRFPQLLQKRKVA
ncbi:MAG: DNA methyltransferase, partial [Candidatus Dormibacteraceae bacterium]